MTGERESQHEADQHGAVVHPSSGPSPPRRPGTGTRQAPLAEQVPEVAWVPGQVLYADEPVVINEGKPVTTVRVVNTADRPVQVGSHFHFAEVNAALAFDRDAAWGRRLAVPSGGAMRFEPGASIEVDLIPIAGRRIVPGLRGMCGGGLDG
jgi:urease subunit beta